jgi:uncharacterized phage-associated protein
MLIVSADEKKGRLLEAAVAVLSGADGQQLNIVLLNKALFYLDLSCLRDFGQPFTCNPFVALEMGPVVAKYPQRLVKQLSDSGLAVQERKGDALPVRLVRRIEAPSFINEAIARRAAKIGQDFSRMTSKQASKLSHDNPGWELAYAEGLKVGKKVLSIDMQIAMQQIVDEDPWLTQPLSRELLTLANAADSGEGESW